MFFWMIMASLMGVIVFGNLHDKTKSQEDFVAPTYQALAFSMFQQHTAALNGYLDAARLDPSSVKTYLDSVTDGVLPLAAVTPVSNKPTMSGVSGDNVIYPYVQKRLPYTYSPQNNTRSYLFCLPNNQIVKEEVPFHCSDPGIVKYIITVRQIPRKNDGVDRMAVMKAISEATDHSRFVGLLAGTKTGLASATEGQPLGSHFFVMSGGYAPVKSVYIPDHIVCNFPLTNNAEGTTLGDTEGFSTNHYAIAVTMLGGGLAAGQNLEAAPAGEGTVCPAITNMTN